jgi:hypothetical protein
LDEPRWWLRPRPMRCFVKGRRGAWQQLAIRPALGRRTCSSCDAARYFQQSVAVVTRGRAAWFMAFMQPYRRTFWPLSARGAAQDVFYVLDRTIFLIGRAICWEATESGAMRVDACCRAPSVTRVPATTSRALAAPASMDLWVRNARSTVRSSELKPGTPVGSDYDVCVCACT